jgi:hypothetical protein
MPRGTTTSRMGPAPKKPSSALAEHKDNKLRAKPKWHSLAKEFWRITLEVGPALNYSKTDYWSAYTFAEWVSRNLKPQYIGNDEDGNPIYEEKPPTAAFMDSVMRALQRLQWLEADRRRLEAEMSRVGSHNNAPAGIPDGVVSLDEQRAKRSRAS